MTPLPSPKEPTQRHRDAEAARHFPSNAQAQDPLRSSTDSAASYQGFARFERELTNIFFKSWSPARSAIRPSRAVTWFGGE